MHSQSQVQRTSRVFPPHTICVCRFLALIIVVCCLGGTPTAARNDLWAQPFAPPLVPPLPPPGPPEGEVLPPAPPEPIFAVFSTSLFIGPDQWLVSGQIVGCADPSSIDVTIGGAVSSGATTDIFGYFEVIVDYDGGIDEVTADADYEGQSIPQAYCQIGF